VKKMRCRSKTWRKNRCSTRSTQSPGSAGLRIAHTVVTPTQYNGTMRTARRNRNWRAGRTGVCRIAARA
jgi:hypothetical protein